MTESTATTAKRTEDEILAHAPIVVQFAGVSYDVQPLPINKARAWRMHMAKEVADVLNQLGIDITPTTGFLGGLLSWLPWRRRRQMLTSQLLQTGLSVALLQFPEKVVELVFSYATDLPRDVILEKATEEEIVLAFSKIMPVAFPFFSQLGMMKSALQVADSFATR